MSIEIKKCLPADIEPLRGHFLHERKFQFVYNKCHDYNWCDDYIFSMDGNTIGYSAVWGSNKREERDAIFEFYLLPPFAGYSMACFEKLRSACNAKYIECQSNDAMITDLLFKYTGNIAAESILFEDHRTTSLVIPGARFRKRSTKDELNGDDSDFVIEAEGALVASGGLMLNYNWPYADIYMQVKEPFRQKGYGSLIVQELKREAWSMMRIPAARCNIRNHISKATLEKAGFRSCGHILKGIL